MKIGTVTNSVIQIKNECEKLLSLNDEFASIEGAIAATDLKEKLKILTDLYEENPSATTKIGECKIIVEAHALRLESILAARCKYARDNYELRQFAKKLYADMKSLQIVISGDAGIDKAERLLIVNELKWVLVFYNAARHILFELDAEDEERIKNIVMLMNRYLSKEAV